MHRFVAFALVFAMTLSAAPLFAAAPVRGRQGQTGSIAGTAKNATNQAMPNAKVQLRSVDPGRQGLTATTQSSATGTFSFGSVPPGDRTSVV